MEKRTLIAVALSFLVLASYPMLMQKIYPDYYTKMDAQKKAKTQSAPTTSAVKTPTNSPAVLKQEDLPLEDDLTFRSASLDLIFNKKDGGIRQVGFVKYPSEETRAPIRMLSLKSVGLSPTSLALILPGNLAMVSDYQIDSSGSHVEMNAEKSGLRVTKQFDFKDPYAADLRLTLENTSGQALTTSYEMVVGSGVTSRNSIDSQYIEANFFSKEGEQKDLKHLKESRLGKQVSSEGFVEWVSVKDRHFSIILKPKSADKFTGLVRGLGNHDLSASLVSSSVTIPAGGKLEHEFTFYVGPNQLDDLLPYGLDDLVNFGKFDGIARLFVGALELLYKGLRNYGVAIIVLTILINVLLFPMTRVSYMSMKRMQLIQPQMNKLREQNKSNPQKLNKEMMELYKKHKVNPFGGCLPMVIQIPIFIALYVALSKFVPLINARLLWIHDLSAPDRIYLPFSLPFMGNYFHLLPLLMCGGMFFQQKLTQAATASSDPNMEAQQKMMAVMMPIIFGFIFYQMPSGLVLYWLTNTVLMTAYQLKLKGMKLAH